MAFAPDWVFSFSKRAPTQAMRPVLKLNQCFLAEAVIL